VFSVLCTNNATKSIVDRLGKAPACCVLRILLVRAVQVILFAPRLSRPLFKQESKAMSCQDCSKVRSRFFTLNIIATSALR